MMVVMDEIASIKSFFQSHQVPLSTVWLESCVNWCKEENLPANYTIKDLQLKVYEQWLLLDLRDVEVPCLPPDLATKKQYTLNGNYSLQMMQVVDISKPKHWQILRIRNNVSKNANEEVESSKRALLLTLTDGVQEIEAMEYKPIPCLNLNLTPGIKIRLMGPISIRRGRLMLQNQNIKVLGGEVDELIIPNAAENVLARFLKLPLNPQPQIIEETMLSANKEMFEETGNAANRTVPQVQNNLMNSGMIQPYVVNRNNQQNLQSVGNRPNIPVSKPLKQIQNNAVGINDEEDMRIAAEIELLMEMEQEFEEPAAKRSKPHSRTPDMFDDMDVNEDDFASIDIPDTIIKTSQNVNNTPIARENNAPGSSTPDDLDLSASLDHDNDVFESIDIDAHLDKIEDKVTKVPEPIHSTPEKSTSSQRSILTSEKISKNPSAYLDKIEDKAKNVPEPKYSTPEKSTLSQKSVLTIEKLLRNIPNISNGKFKIKAKFKSIVEKLTVEDNEFYLVVKVEDDTSDITVRIHSDVVADLAEYCPMALLSLKSSIIENNAEAQRKVLETLRRLKEKLLRLDNVVEVQVSVREKYPVIVNILQV